MKLPALNDFESTFNDPIWLEVARDICARHALEAETIRRSPHGDNIVFFLGESYVLKIYSPLRNGYNREKNALEFADGVMDIPIPEIAFDGEIEGFYYIVMTQLRGEVINRKEWFKLEDKEQLRIVTQLGAQLKKLHSYDASGVRFDWTDFIKVQVFGTVDRQVAAGVNQKIIAELPEFIKANKPLLPKVVEDPVFMHGDIHFGNLLMMEAEGKWKISGLFDFADSLTGFHEYDFLAPSVLMIQGQGDLQREFFRAYGYKDSEIDENLRRRLMLLTILYECSNLKKYAQRLKAEAVDYSLEELERGVWNFV